MNGTLRRRKHLRAYARAKHPELASAQDQNRAQGGGRFAKSADCAQLRCKGTFECWLGYRRRHPAAGRISLVISHRVSIDSAPEIHKISATNRTIALRSSWITAAILCDTPLRRGARKLAVVRNPRIKLFRQTYFPFANPIEQLVSDRTCTQTVHLRDTLAPQTVDFGPGT